MGSVTGFILCAAVIFFAGKRLSFYGDLIAEKTGLGKAWVGLILMASITSLPELIVGISSSFIVQDADLAVGNVAGSCTFNLAILAMLDLALPRRQHIFYTASTRHVFSASLGIVLLALVGIGLYLPQQIVILPGIGLISLVFLVLYLLSMRLIYRFEQKDKLLAELSPPAAASSLSLRQVLLRYGWYSVVTIAAALFIPYFANAIAILTGLQTSFVGTFFVAGSTSLPEIAVSLAAVRSGSVDLAIGSLLGSNIFNVLTLAINDIFYTKGILLKDASGSHLVSVLSSIVMTAVVIAGFTYRAPQTRFWMAVDALVVLLVYFLNLFLLFFAGKP